MLFEATDVVFDRGKRNILDSFNLNVEAGNATALVGPNGSGKTTFIKLATGYLRPKSGAIQILGSQQLGPKRRARLGVVWQDRGLPLAVSSERWLAHLGRLYSMPVDVELVEKLGISVTRQPMRYLSGGEQQRIALYGALAHRPKLLLLDEPTVGLDDDIRGVFYTLIRQRLNEGTGVIFTSHYAQDVAVLAHHIVDLNREPRETTVSALFSVNGILDVFRAVEALPDGYQLVATTNGYRLKGPDQATLLTIAMNLASLQDLELLNFTVVSHV